jgi:DNA-binding GntR family transcriptional regulator
MSTPWQRRTSADAAPGWHPRRVHRPIPAVSALVSFADVLRGSAAFARGIRRRSRTVRALPGRRPADLESVLGATPHEFESRILRQHDAGPVPSWGRPPVARQTVRQAVAQLVAEGLVVSQRPRGHFVRERTHYRYSPQREFRPPVSAEMDRFMGQVTLEDGRTPSQTIDVGLVQASPEVAQRLGVEPGQIVVARRRVRSIDGEPFNINDTFYPLELVQGTAIMSPADVPEGTNQLLAELGHPQDRALDEIYVRMPTPDETRRLELQPGTPVAMHICTG